MFSPKPIQASRMQGMAYSSPPSQEAWRTWEYQLLRTLHSLQVCKTTKGHTSIEKELFF